MNYYRWLFIANAFVAVVFGLGFLLIPDRVLALFGTTEKYASTLLLGRFFGTAMLALGLVVGLASNVSDPTVQRGMGIALVIGAVAGLVVTLIGTFASNAVIRSNGWIAMVLYLLFGLAYAYLVFLRPNRPSEE
jgi:hypothetical protein